MKTGGDSRAAQNSVLTSEIVSGGIEIVDGLEEEWRTLCEEEAEPFYRPEWVRAYVRAFAPGKTLCIATVRDNGRLVAVLPLIREVGSLGGLPARKLRSAGNVHTYRFDILRSRIEADAAISAIWDALKRARDWDVVQLERVPIHSGLGRLARLARDDGHPARIMHAMPSPHLVLPDREAGPASILQRTHAKFRESVQRRMRKLCAQGAVQFVRSRAADSELERFYELERSGWKGAHGSAIASRPATRQFYDEIAREAAKSGYFVLDTLQCAGRTVAMQYGLEYRDRYFLLKSAYDESLAACSPGHLLIHEVLNGLVARGFVGFDMMGYLNQAKRDWAPQLRPHADYYIFSRQPVGRLLYTLRFRVRPALGRALRRPRTKREEG